MDNQLALAPCGIDCSVCPIYLAAHDMQAAEHLAEQWRANGFPKAQAGWFRCRGCRGEPSLRWSEDCAIAQCCTEEKGLAHCALCAQFPCPRLEAWGEKGHHRAALERLRGLRDAG